MREVEVKAKTNDLKAAESKLVAMGALIAQPVIQADRVYLQNGTAFEEVTVNTPVLRIREQNPGETLLTYKHIRGEELDKQEHEVVVSNASEMEQILKLSGFYEAVAFTKTRRKCKLGDYEICLDNVEGLGGFIEIEKLIPDSHEGPGSNGQDVQRELFDFLRQLGVREQDKVLSGYDVLIYNMGNSKLKGQNSK
ncbi:MAG: class IV adenylate cyclase, partial [Candidatus Doudnabacteria bacterium]|nr:class IV adenylate cyclase [Candidatus Doudnabacteria bacterium]